MKNTHLLILGLIMAIVVTGYAIEEPQGFMDVYAIPTKNYHHRYTLDTMYEGSRNGARATMDNDHLAALLTQQGRHDAVLQMRMQARERALRYQEYWRQEAYQELKKWGYQV